MAPFLSFTAEEAWQILQPDASTIFIETYHAFPTLANTSKLLEKWARLRAIRSEVTKALEDARGRAEIGSSLQAEVTLYASGMRYADLVSLGESLKFMLITSAAQVTEVESPEAEKIVIAASVHPKCERCWHQLASVGKEPAHPTLCARCIANVFCASEAIHNETESSLS
jgi:isoleucyl-tRNA synthetase